MPAIYEHPHLVLESEIDDQGHVNNLHYLRWMLDAAVAHSSARGWPPERYREIGAGWVVRAHQLEYHQPAFAGEEIVVRTWVSAFKKVTSRRRYKVFRAADNALLAAGETSWAYVALAERLPRRVPAELATAFLIVPPDAEP